MPVNYYRPGLGNVGSFQTSGIPWCSSSVNVPASGAAVEAHRIDFPYITKRLVVRNDGTPTIRVGFSDQGVRGMYNNKYYFSGQDCSTQSHDMPINWWEIWWEIKLLNLWSIGNNDKEKVSTNQHRFSWCGIS